MQQPKNWSCLVFVCVCFVAAVLTGCEKNETCIMPANVSLEEGDIVFRRGGGFTSHAVLVGDHGGQYSHVGIGAEEGGRKMIVHAVPGEPDFDGDPDRVKMDTPEVFFSSLKTNIGEVCRVADKATARRAARCSTTTTATATPRGCIAPSSSAMSIVAPECRSWARNGIA